MGASPMARCLSSCTPLWWPRVSPVQILGADMALLIRPCWGGVPHSTTRGTHNYNIQLCTGGLWEEEEEKKKKEYWQQMLAQVPIFKRKNKTETLLWSFLMEISTSFSTPGCLFIGYAHVHLYKVMLSDFPKWWFWFILHQLYVWTNQLTNLVINFFIF